MTLSPSVTRFVVVAASIAAVLELVLLRLLTRTAVFIPGISERIGVVSAVGELGRLLYSVSVALLGTMLLMLTALAVQRTSLPGRMVAAALIAFATFALMARVGWIPRIAVDVMTLGAFVMVARMVRPRRRAATFAVVALSLALALACVDAIWRSIAGVTAIPGTSGVFLNLAEWLVVVAALAAIVAHRHAAGASLVWAAVLGGVLLIALLVASATVRILLLWNVGLPGGLPSVAYGAAAVAVGMTVGTAARGGRLATAAGVTLLVAGGLGLHSTYQSGLVLAGLAVLALRQTLDGEWREAVATPRERASPDPLSLVPPAHTMKEVR